MHTTYLPLKSTRRLHFVQNATGWLVILRQSMHINPINFILKLLHRLSINRQVIQILAVTKLFIALVLLHICMATFPPDSFMHLNRAFCRYHPANVQNQQPPIHVHFLLLSSPYGIACLRNSEMLPHSWLAANYSELNYPGGHFLFLHIKFLF